MQKQAVTAQTSPPPIPRRGPSFDPDAALAFGRVIRAMREKAQVAQDAFALVAGIDRSYYGKLERGERQPSLGLILRVSEALGVSAAEIVAEVESLREASKKPVRRPKVERR